MASESTVSCWLGRELGWWSVDSKVVAPLKQANQRLNALIAIKRIRQVNLMSGSAQSMSFQDLIDAVETMPLDDQAMLANLINKRIQEKRRAELLAEVQEARDAFSRGEVKRGSFEDLMKDLKD